MTSASTRQMGMGVAVANSRSLVAFDTFTANLGGHAPAMWTLWVSWGSGHGVRCDAQPECSFPNTALLDGLHAKGTAPMINWQPYNSNQSETDSRFRYERIIEGKFDSYIRKFARDAKAWGQRVYLRFAHEMNGPWFPWGIGRFNNTSKNFKQAWRHVYRIFQSVGATRVKFLWSPNSPCGECVDYSKIYPGNSYVHYVGFSRFNWSSRTRPWRSMERLYATPISALRKVAPHKKIIVTETGSSPKGGNKANWIARGYPAIYNRWPRVVAIVYLDMRVLDHPDWRLKKPTFAVRDAYATLAARIKFQRLFT